MPETKDPNAEFKPLAYFSNPAQAGMARELLLGNGISAVLQGANFGGLEPLPMVGGYSEIQLLVPSAEFEQAQDLYRAFFENDDATLTEDQEVDDADHESAKPK